jgi:hypothetical protein
MSHVVAHKKAMLAALEKTLGIVTQAAKLAGIDRKTHQRWCKDDKTYKAAVDDIENLALDFAESQLYELIKEKNFVSTIFYLKCKGKRRGYVEKNEIGFTNADGSERAFEITLNLNQTE